MVTVEVFKTWVGAKPGRRSVKVEVEAAGEEQGSVSLDARGLGASLLRDLGVRALKDKHVSRAGEAQDW